MTTREEFAAAILPAIITSSTTAAFCASEHGLDRSANLLNKESWVRESFELANMMIEESNRLKNL